MSEVGDAVVVADDLHMVEVATVAERQATRESNGARASAHAIASTRESASPSNVRTSATTWPTKSQESNLLTAVANDWPGPEARCRMSISRQGAIRAQERIVPIFNTQGSPGGFTPGPSRRRGGVNHRAEACTFMEPLRLDRGEELRSLDEARSQSFWNQGKEGSEIA